jgi:hypothetical protein
MEPIKDSIMHALSLNCTAVMSAMKNKCLGNHIIVEQNMSTVLCQPLPTESRQYPVQKKGTIFFLQIDIIYESPKQTVS